LSDAARRRLAAAVAPPVGPPVVAVATAPPAATAPPVARATDVSSVDAVAWFDRRLPTYRRLAAAAGPFVEQDGVIFDIGANIGYFTTVLAETTGFRGRAHLFEPLPHLVDLCRERMATYDLDAEIHGFGLSDEDTDVDLYVASSGNLGWNTIVAEKANATMVATRIEVRRFDTCGIADRPSFVKIDVEGAEYKVLTGMLEALERWSPRPAILCEIGWGKQHPAWADELEVFAQLGKLGYTTTDLAGSPIDLTTLTRTTDVLFVPPR